MSRVPAALLVLLVILPLHAATITLSPEVPLLSDAAIAAPGHQYDPFIAASPDGFLVVWSTEVAERSRYSVTAQRFSHAGEPLDALPTRIADACTRPYAAWNGNGYFVYANCDLESVPEKRGVLATSLTRDGIVIARTFLDNADWISDLATNGSETVVLGIERQSGRWALWRIGPDGLPERTIPLWSPPNSYVVDALVIPNRNTWIVFRHQGASPLLRTIVENDVARVEEAVAYVGSIGQMSHATDGSTRLLAWNYIEVLQNGTGFIQQVAGIYLDLEGHPISDAFTISTDRSQTAFVPSADAPAVIWDGTRYVVVWSWFDGYATHEVRAREADRPLTTTQVVLERRSSPDFRGDTRPVVATSGGHGLLAWLAPRPGQFFADNDLVGRNFTSFASLQSASTTFVGHSAAPEEAVRLAIDDQQTFAVWREGGESSGVARGQILGRTERFAISDAAWSGESPAVARLGAIHLAAWREELWIGNARSSYRILARRYDRDGREIDASPLLLAEGTHLQSVREESDNSVDVATDGTQFFVVWHGGDAQIRGARVSAGGKVLDATPLQLSTAAASYHAWPSVAWNGREFFVTWREDPSRRDLFGQIATPLPVIARAALVRPDRTIASTFRLAEGPANVDWTYVDRFAAGSNAQEIVVAWSVNRSAVDSCTYAQRFALDGRALESVRTVRCTASPKERRVRSSIDVAWDGREWWIATAGVGDANDAQAIPLDRPADAITITPEPASEVAFFSSPNGLSIAYSRLHAEQLVWRAYVRTLFRGERTRTVHR